MKNVFVSGEGSYYNTDGVHKQSGVEWSTFLKARNV